MKFQKTFQILIITFLVLVFSFPRVLQDFKIILLALLVILLIVMKKNIYGIVKFFLIYLLFFITPIIVASIYGNETGYVMDGIKIYYFFPLILAAVFYATDRRDFQKIIYISSVISLVIITLVSLTTLLNGFGIFPVNVNALFYKDEDRIGINQGFIHIINSPLSYYLFLIPIAFHNAGKFKLNNINLYFFIALFVFAILTGRRILLLPFILVILYQFISFYKYIIFIVIGTLMFLSNNKFENFDPATIVSRFEEAINSSGDSEAREEQNKYFAKYIDDNPFFGYGIGAYMKDHLRNYEFKTAYERSYEYLIFCIGIPLAVLLMSLYLYMLYNAWKLGEKDDSLNKGIIIGIISLILASYTNPYWLSSFDYVIPFALLITFSIKKGDA